MRDQPLTSSCKAYNGGVPCVIQILSAPREPRTPWPFNGRCSAATTTNASTWPSWRAGMVSAVPNVRPMPLPTGPNHDGSKTRKGAWPWWGRCFVPKCTTWQRPSEPLPGTENGHHHPVNVYMVMWRGVASRACVAVPWRGCALT